MLSGLCYGLIVAVVVTFIEFIPHVDSVVLEQHRVVLQALASGLSEMWFGPAQGELSETLVQSGSPSSEPLAKDSQHLGLPETGAQHVQNLIFGYDHPLCTKEPEFLNR